MEQCICLLMAPLAATKGVRLACDTLMLWLHWALAQAQKACTGDPPKMKKGIVIKNHLFYDSKPGKYAGACL